MLYREINDIAPVDAASLRFELGSTHLTLGRYAKAEKTLSDALDMALTADLDKSAQEVLQLRQALAEHALAVGNYDKTQNRVSRRLLTIEKNSMSPNPILNRRTDCLLHTLILADFLSPELTTLMQYKQRMMHYQSQKSIIARAIQIVAIYFYSSGTIYYEAGDYGKAEELLEKASSDS